MGKLVLAAFLVVALVTTAAAAATISETFKGTWTGPPRADIPGPGPKQGEPLEHYFENLKTGDRQLKPFHVLVLGGSRGFHHDSISAAMAAIYHWGQTSKYWDAELRTDFDLVTDAGGGPMNAGFQPKGLRDFDAVVIANAEGDWGLRPDQKAALLAFVHDKGKGLVVIHSGIEANHSWHDYLDMIGAEQTGHPFNTLNRVVRPFTLVNEDATFPATAQFPSRFVKQDELYVVRNWSRTDIDVLLSLDPASLDVKGIEDQVPPDLDIPIAWEKMYGSGRVFASSLGHSKDTFEDPDIVHMYAEAIKWALHLTDGGRGPHLRDSSGTLGASRR